MPRWPVCGHRRRSGGSGRPSASPATRCHAPPPSRRSRGWSSRPLADRPTAACTQTMEMQAVGSLAASSPRAPPRRSNRGSAGRSHASLARRWECKLRRLTRAARRPRHEPLLGGRERVVIHRIGASPSAMATLQPTTVSAPSPPNLPLPYPLGRGSPPTTPRVGGPAPPHAPGGRRGPSPARPARLVHVLARRRPPELGAAHPADGADPARHPRARRRPVPDVAHRPRAVRGGGPFDAHPLELGMALIGLAACGT